MKAVKFATQIDKSVLKDLKTFALKQDKSISKVVTEAVFEYLQKYHVRPVFTQSMEKVIVQHHDLLNKLAK